MPFVAHYRKEATGELDDAQLRTLDERLRYLRELDERRAAILDSISQQGNPTRAQAGDRRGGQTGAARGSLFALSAETADEGSNRARSWPGSGRDRGCDRLCAGPDRDCHPAVFAGHNDQDDRAAHATRRKHRSGDRLGIRRDRRLYARIETGRKTGNSDRVESIAVLDRDIARNTSQSISRHRDQTQQWRADSLVAGTGNPQYLTHFEEH